MGIIGDRGGQALRRDAYLVRPVGGIRIWIPRRPPRKVPQWAVEFSANQEAQIKLDAGDLTKRLASKLVRKTRKALRSGVVVGKGTNRRRVADHPRGFDTGRLARSIRATKPREIGPHTAESIIRVASDRAEWLNQELERGEPPYITTGGLVNKDLARVLVSWTRAAFKEQSKRVGATEPDSGDE